MAPFGVGEEPVEASRDVSKVKADRGDTAGTRLHLNVAEARAPQFDILGGELQRVQDLTRDSLEFGERAS